MNFPTFSVCVCVRARNYFYEQESVNYLKTFRKFWICEAKNNCANWVLHGAKTSNCGPSSGLAYHLDFAPLERANGHERQHFSLTLLLACIFLVYLQLPQANSEKMHEVKPRLLPVTLSSIDYVIDPYITLLTASVNRLSLLLHSSDYFIFAILTFYNFLQ